MRDVPAGLPTVQLPPFSTSENISGTIITETVWGMISDLSSGVVVVPLIGLLEDIAICKAFGKKNPQSFFSSTKNFLQQMENRWMQHKNFSQLVFPILQIHSYSHFRVLGLYPEVLLSILVASGRH